MDQNEGCACVCGKELYEDARRRKKFPHKLTKSARTRLILKMKFVILSLSRYAVSATSTAVQKFSFGITYTILTFSRDFV